MECSIIRRKSPFTWERLPTLPHVHCSGALGDRAGQRLCCSSQLGFMVGELRREGQLSVTVIRRRGQAGSLETLSPSLDSWCRGAEVLEEAQLQPVWCLQEMRRWYQTVNLQRGRPKVTAQ